jgi:hypothetical protein
VHCRVAKTNHAGDHDGRRKAEDPSRPSAAEAGDREKNRPGEQRETKRQKRPPEGVQVRVLRRAYEYVAIAPVAMRGTPCDAGEAGSEQNAQPAESRLRSAVYAVTPTPPLHPRSVPIRSEKR